MSTKQFLRNFKRISIVSLIDKMFSPILLNKLVYEAAQCDWCARQIDLRGTHYAYLLAKKSNAIWSPKNGCKLLIG